MRAGRGVEEEGKNPTSVQCSACLYKCNYAMFVFVGNDFNAL